MENDKPPGRPCGDRRSAPQTACDQSACCAHGSARISRCAIEHFDKHVSYFCSVLHRGCAGLFQQLASSAGREAGSEDPSFDAQGRSEESDQSKRHVGRMTNHPL